MHAIYPTLKKIYYYRDSWFFQKKEDLLYTYDCVKEVIKHVEKMATIGKKYPLFLNENWGGASYKLYNNEVYLGDNTILVDARRFKIAFINHSVINYIGSRNAEFCNHIYHSIQNIMQLSMLISSTVEKERARFFNQMRENIDRRRRIAEQMDY